MFACLFTVPTAVHTQVASGNWCRRNLSAAWHPSRAVGSQAACFKFDGPTDQELFKQHVCIVIYDWFSIVQLIHSNLFQLLKRSKRYIGISY